MLTLNDGRSELWQWDTGRTLAVDADCSQVHFSNKVFGRSIDVDVVDGAAIIPDILLQTDNDLNVWAFAGTAENGYTKISKTFTVNRRNKPADYVFTPVEQTTIAEIAAIAQSVRDDADAGRFDGAQGPAGAPGKDGAGMDITGATVGQIAKITAVDASGVPTAWSPADMPSGGSTDAVLYTPQTLTDAQKKQARNNVDAASSDFVITGSLTEAGGITLDKTFAQIQEAVQAGKTALMRIDGGPTTITLPLAVKNSDVSTEYDFSIGYFIDGRLNGVTVRVMESGPVLYTASTPTNNPDGTMPQVSMAADPTRAMQIATKQYVDASGVPPVTAADNGKFLRVVNGAWAAAEISSANGVSF